MTLLAIAAVAAMDGPTLTAFDQRCEALRRDEPSLTCTRTARTKVAGHPVEIWVTRSHRTDGDDDLDEIPQDVGVWAAVQTHAGWYVASVASFTTFHENGHHNAGGSIALGRIDARQVKRAGARVLRVKVDETWDRFCTPCGDTPAEQHTHGTDTVTASCTIDDALVPSCELPDAAP